MDSEFTNELLSVGTNKKATYALIVQNIGKIIAVITCIVALLVSFTDVSFGDPGAKEITSNLIIMLICSYLMYFSLESSGEKAAAESEAYRCAEQRYKAVRARIKPQHIPLLRSFCGEYADAEFRYRKDEFLVRMGYSSPEYELYKKTGSCDNASRRAFLKCDRMKRVRLTPAILLGGRGTNSGELDDPSRRKLPMLIAKMLPTTGCMIFTVSVVLSLRTDMGSAAVIESVLKLLTLPIIGFRGYMTGYSYVEDSEAPWLETKARLLESFIARTDE